MTSAQIDALLSLSRLQRRLAHEAKREALKWEHAGNRNFYRDCRAESDRLWQEAKYHLGQAKRWRLHA